MANEIQVSIALSVTKNGATNSATCTKTITMAGDQMINNVQVVATSEEALQLGDVSTIGWLFVKNLDTTNFIMVGESGAIEAGVETSGSSKVLPGEAILVKPFSTGLYAVANTAPCNVQVFAVEL